MMGSSVKADPLSGFIAMLSDPDAAKEKLVEFAKAKQDIEAYQKEVAQKAVEVDRREKDIEAQTKALDEREREVQEREVALAAAQEGLDTDLQHLKSKRDELEKDEALAVERHKIRVTELAAQKREITAAQRGADQRVEEAGRAEERAQEAKRAADEAQARADALAEEYSNKLAKLRSIILEGSNG